MAGPAGKPGVQNKRWNGKGAVIKNVSTKDPFRSTGETVGQGKKKGIVNARFGKTGKPVKVGAKAKANAAAGRGKLYEDGSYMPKPPPKGRGSKTS